MNHKMDMDMEEYRPRLIQCEQVEQRKMCDHRGSCRIADLCNLNCFKSVCKLLLLSSYRTSWSASHASRKHHDGAGLRPVGVGESECQERPTPPDVWGGLLHIYKLTPKVKIIE